MHTATVYYIDLSDEQVKEVNSKGWDSDVGRAYLNAKTFADRDPAKKLGMVVPAAVLRTSKRDAEAVWARLQNGVHSEWMADIIWQKDRRRSMDVGDFIIWDDGVMERCVDLGFEVE